MLGKIIEILENSILLQLSNDFNITSPIMNKYVMVDDEHHKIIGEIVNVKAQVVSINLLGEIINQQFIFGLIAKPSLSANVYLLTDEATSIIIGMQQDSNHQELYIGNSPIYQSVKIGANVNQLFSNHFSILGSTGSGKSSSFARIIQNLFSMQSHVAYYANIFLFDAYGEYHNAFQSISNINPNISFKTYTTDLTSGSEIIRIPVWLLGVDELALLLGVEKHAQLPILEKTMKLVNVFARAEEEVIKHKNDIIARALLDILSSGRTSTQIRDQILSILSTYHTSQLNLNTEIVQPGYTRTLRQCLMIDSTGKIRDIDVIMNVIQEFLDDSLELSMPNGSFAYTLEDIEKALEFALISEGILKSDKIYDENNLLKVRLHSLIHSDNLEFFKYPGFVTREEYIRRLLTTSAGKKAQIINFNINYIDDNFAKVITKIYSKLLFDYAKSLTHRASISFHIILEEAHRYVQNDNDNYLLGYNIFERITKEGRKYGVLLGLICQRPSELSKTCVSQCSNFLIFKIIYPDDIEYVYKMIPNITHEIVNQFKILPPGHCIAFGTAFKMPIMIKLNMPNPTPNSNSCDISKIWFLEVKK